MTHAFLAGGEAAWPRSQAVEVVRYAADRGVVVLGGEVWLPGPSTRRIARPRVFPFAWAVTDQVPGESHEEYVERARRESVAAIEQFAWPGTFAKRFGKAAPLFNLTF